MNTLYHIKMDSKQTFCQTWTHSTPDRIPHEGGGRWGGGLGRSMKRGEGWGEGVTTSPSELQLSAG